MVVYHSPAQLFSSVHSSFSALPYLEWLSLLQQSPVPLQFLLSNVVIATDAMSIHWAFYFQGSGLPLLVSRFWSFSMCMVYIALQELQAVATMLHRMAFWLSGKWLPCVFDNSTAKALFVESKWSSITISFQTGMPGIESD